MRGKPRAVKRSQDFIFLKVCLAIGSVLFILLHYYLAYRRIINQ